MQHVNYFCVTFSFVYFKVWFFGSFDKEVENLAVVSEGFTVCGSGRTLNPSHLELLREILSCIFLHASL